VPKEENLAGRKEKAELEKSVGSRRGMNEKGKWMSALW